MVHNIIFLAFCVYLMQFLRQLYLLTIFTGISWVLVISYSTVTYNVVFSRQKGHSTCPPEKKKKKKKTTPLGMTEREGRCCCRNLETMTSLRYHIAWEECVPYSHLNYVSCKITGNVSFVMWSRIKLRPSWDRQDRLPNIGVINFWVDL